jgi:hypothetical protein
MLLLKALEKKKASQNGFAIVFFELGVDIRAETLCASGVWQ